jgi:hypothetical protein
VVELGQLLGREVVERRHHPGGGDGGLHVRGNRAPGRDQGLEFGTDTNEGVGHADHYFAVERARMRMGGRGGRVPRCGDDDEVGFGRLFVEDGRDRQLAVGPLALQVGHHALATLLRPRADEHLVAHRRQPQGERRTGRAGGAEDADPHGASGLSSSW